MKIAIACDHAGYEYKERLVKYLREKGHEVKDFGTYSAESMDYPDTAHPMAAAVEAGEYERGIAICGSGNGISMNIKVFVVLCAGTWSLLLWRVSIIMRTWLDCLLVSLLTRKLKMW